MAIFMKLDDEIDKIKWLKDEDKIELKKQNKGKTICPIMSPQTIQWNGDYAVCVKELCEFWNDWREQCAFYKRAEGEKEKDTIRIYTKIFADEEPQDKADKIYRICANEELVEIMNWLKEYIENEEGEEYQTASEMREHCEKYEPTYNLEDGSM